MRRCAPAAILSREAASTAAAADYWSHKARLKLDDICERDAPLAITARPTFVGIRKMTIPNPPLHCPLTNPSSSRHFLHSQDVNGGYVVHVAMITQGTVEVNRFGNVSIANFRTVVLYCRGLVPFSSMD